MVQYDSRIIEKFAEKLYAQANRIVALYVVLFAIGGALVGAALANDSVSVRAARDRSISVWPIILGGLMLGALGYVVGQARAFQLRLQAQTALCQVKIEQNTRAAAPPRP